MSRTCRVRARTNDGRGAVDIGAGVDLHVAAPGSAGPRPFSASSFRGQSDGAWHPLGRATPRGSFRPADVCWVRELEGGRPLAFLR